MTGFQDNGKGTVIIVDGKIYDLVPSDWTWLSLKSADPKERPQCRCLNDIQQKTIEEQIEHDEGAKVLHDIFKKHCLGESTRGKFSPEKIVQNGGNVSDEVQKLLDLKEKTHDKKDKKKIRRQLRKLGYKKYLE